jgi:hypothetical protein
MVLCLGWVQNPDRSYGSCLGSMFDVTLPGSLGIIVYQDHDSGHYREKKSHPSNDAMKIQTPKSR